MTRPWDAARYSIAYHRALAAVSRDLEVDLTARVGLHVGDVLLRQERYAEAAELLLPGLEAARGMKSGNPGIAAYHLGTLGRSLAAAGRGDEARPILEEARDLLVGAESEGERRHLGSIEAALESLDGGDPA